MAKRSRGDGGLFMVVGSRYWHGQYYDSNGRPHRFSTKKYVKEKAKAVLRDRMADSGRGVQSPEALKQIRYGDLRAALIQNYIEKGNRSLQTTADGTETVWGLKDLDDFFEYKGADAPGVSAAQLTTDAARAFAKKRLAEGVTNSTVNTSLASLRRMLNIAHEDGKIQVVPKIRLLKANPARKGFVLQETFDKLLEHIPQNLKPLILFLYYCGVRKGEALQIEWSQVDLDRAVIRIEDEQAKSGEARTVPLPDVLVDILRKAEPKTGFVFDGTNHRKEWQAACVAAKLGTLEGRVYSGLLIHDLRRSAIKNLMKAGVNEKVAMAISGHKTRAVFDRYHIVDETDVVNAMRRVQVQAGSPTLVRRYSDRTVTVVQKRRRIKK